MSGFKLPQHARNHRTGGSDPIVFPPATLEWAAGVGEENVLDGVPNKVSFDPLGLYTESSDIFSIDAGTGYTGLGISEPGTYLTGYGVQCYANSTVTNPETFVVKADEGGLETTLGPLIGSIFEYGFPGESGDGEWYFGWWKLIAIHSATGGAPLVITVTQNTGVTLDTIVSFYVTKLTSNRFGA